MSLASSVAAAAAAAINKYGRTIQYTSVSNGTYSPSTSSSVESTSSTPVKAVVENPTQSDINADRVQSSGKKFTLVADAVPLLAVNDTWVADGLNYATRGIHTTYVGEIPVVHEIWADQA